MFCWARYLLIAVVAVLGIVSMLGACGQKGPLYLPQDTPAQSGANESDVPLAPEAPGASTSRPNRS